MSHSALYVRRIWQKDNYTFSIQWNDELVQDFRLCDLQRNCPCARCTDENTGLRVVDPKTVPEDVSAVAVKSIGRYGLRVQFTAGCSLGIFSFEKLRRGFHA